MFFTGLLMKCLINDKIGRSFHCWDTHSFADYWDEAIDVEIEVTAPRRRRVAIEPELWEKIAAQARAKGITVETLVNVWLAERVAA